jgi:hypothetical protein
MSKSLYIPLYCHSIVGNRNSRALRQTLDSTFQKTTFSHRDRSYTSYGDETTYRPCTPSNIRAGWTRTGIKPWDPSRVLELPSVKNFRRCTPDLQLPAHPDGVYGTLTKISEFKELQERIEARVTPHTRRHIHKLARGAIHELTTSQILQSEVRDTRK